MNFFDHPYFKLDKNISRLIGRWPYQSRWESRICSFVIIFLYTSQFIAKILEVIVNFDDKVMILESITPFMIDGMVGVKYINAVLNVKTMMKLLDQLRKNWGVYTKEEERRILHRYAYIGQLIVYGYLVAVYVTTLVFITEPLLPKLINFLLKLNKTIPNKYPVPINWYIIDMEDNFYPILCYESICIIAILTITVANDSMFIILLEHACALFTVVGYQLKNLPKLEKLERIRIHGGKFTKPNDNQYDYYIMCIKNHKIAIEFAKLLEELYVWTFGFVIGFNMVMMSVTAVQIVSQADTIQEIIKYSMFTCTQIMHLFFNCYLSQRLADSSVAIHEHVIHSKWYGMPLKTQKLVTLVTLRSQMPCRLTAGKMMYLSMETFGAIVKTSISYFTVMLSMQ